jgi:hypothetical protein
MSNGIASGVPPDGYCVGAGAAGAGDWASACEEIATVAQAAKANGKANDKANEIIERIIYSPPC